MQRVGFYKETGGGEANGIGLKEDDLEAALEGFNSVLQKEEDEDDKSDWKFKAKKQKIKVLYQLGEATNGLNTNGAEILTAFKELLRDIETGKVSRNYAEKTLNNMLGYLAGLDKTAGGAAAGSEGESVLKKVYDATLAMLSKTGNERMWIKTKMRLAKQYLEQDQLDSARIELEQVQDVCTTATTATTASTANTGSEDDNTKSTFLMEVYSLLMQLYSATSNYKKVKELYSKTMSIKSAISHPRILGVIHECGGKIHMREKRWEAAREDLFESFKNYDEAGSLQRIQVLKYFVLACMLSESGINPFESQETKPYKQDPNVMVMMHLVEAFQRSDVEEFNRLLKSHRQEIMGDPLIRSFLDDVILSIRSQGIINLVRPYSRVSLAYIASALEVTPAQARDLVVRLILDHRLPTARIDNLEDYVELRRSEGPARLAALMGTADVPVFHRNAYRGLPVAVASSMQRAQEVMQGPGVKKSSARETESKSVSKGGESASKGAAGGSAATAAVQSASTKRGMGGARSEGLLGTAVMSQRKFACFPDRYAKALEDELSVESGRQVVGAKGGGVGGGGDSGDGVGGADDKKADAGAAGKAAEGSKPAADASSAGQAMMDLLAVETTRGDGAGSDLAQSAALQEWVDRILEMQRVVHGNPRALQSEG